MMKIISAITAAVVMSGGALAINGYAKAPSVTIGGVHDKESDCCACRQHGDPRAQWYRRRRLAAYVSAVRGFVVVVELSDRSTQSCHRYHLYWVRPYNARWKEALPRRLAKTRAWKFSIQPLWCGYDGSEMGYSGSWKGCPCRPPCLLT
jgi:hypothetical protein